MGNQITLDDKQYEIAALTLNQLEALATEFDHIAAATVDPTTEKALAASRAYRLIVSAALNKHHPEITDQSVGDLLTIVNRNDVFAKVLQASGLATSGEQPAASQSEP